MRFGPVPIHEAVGGILAHLYSAGSRKFLKGQLLTTEDVAALERSGHETLIVARLEDGDLVENEAAATLAPSLSGDNVYADKPRSGRVNLRAGKRGLLLLEAAKIAKLNLIDPMIMVATLPAFSRIERGDLIATIKIISFGVAGDSIKAAKDLSAPLTVAPYHPQNVSLIQTVHETTKISILDKTVAVTASRLAALNSKIVAETRISHDRQALSCAILEAKGDMIIVFGASAVSDYDDIIPSAIRDAGGSIKRFGMPVDPGNLLVLGEIDGRAVIGAPGCARSPKENGFDWILARLAARQKVESDDIAQMGVGGLLKEISTRPKKREE